MHLNDYDSDPLGVAYTVRLIISFARELNHDNNASFVYYLTSERIIWVPRKCMDTIMTTQTITVLYYPAELAIKPIAEVLYDLEVGVSGRVIIPTEYKVDKIIVAVFKGEVEMLNALGDRVASELNDVA
jgi:hypothetical protein